ncbi:hypothetical protein MANES_05G086328v8 [Manihot esculenta]|uniref:Uncharacterized protein n=1 Tax=Manihot esculenta TaxID=3983 RepID=A0ACB7HNV0_MANES|nr:hypothetical protein MANES_05G086328v8 [Manihot esculenta]
MAGFIIPLLVTKSSINLTFRELRIEKRIELDCPGKKAWPELVGIDANCAAVIIEKENKHVKAIMMEDGKLVPRDLRCNRVWVFVDKNNVVTKIPRVG